MQSVSMRKYSVYIKTRIFQLLTALSSVLPLVAVYLESLESTTFNQAEDVLTDDGLVRKTSVEQAVVVDVSRRPGHCRVH